MAPVLFPHGRGQADAAGRRYKCRRVSLRLCDTLQRHDLVNQAVLLGLSGSDKNILVH